MLADPDDMTSTLSGPVIDKRHPITHSDLTRPFPRIHLEVIDESGSMAPSVET